MLLLKNMPNSKLQGYLYKQSDYLGNWNERFFVLEDTTLSYFVNKDDARPRMIIDLREAIISGIGIHTSIIHMFNSFTHLLIYVY